MYLASWTKKKTEQKKKPVSVDLVTTDGTPDLNISLWCDTCALCMPVTQLNHLLVTLLLLENMALYSLKKKKKENSQ